MTKMKPKNTDQSYSGWSNYETWNFKLWLDNEQETQEMVFNFVKNAVVFNGNSTDAIHKIRTLLEEYAEQNAPELKNGFYSDILSASINSVNFYQIADAYFYDFLEEHKTDIYNNWGDTA